MSVSTPKSRRTPRPARRRPRSYVRGPERRRQILEVAARLFSQRGYAGTTTKQIATAAGIGETVLFRQFPTKGQLYEDLLEHRIPAANVENWLRELRAIAERRDDEALFSAVVDGILFSYREDVVTQRLMLFAALENHELGRIFQLKYTAPIAAFLREYVSRRQAEGAFRPLRAEIVVHALLAGPAHFAQWDSLGVNPFGLSVQDVRTHARTLLDAIRMR